MKICFAFPLTLAAVFFLFAASPVFSAEDMREQRIEARTTLKNLQAKAAAEEQSAREEAMQSREKIAGDRVLLDRELHRVEAEVATLEQEVAALQAEDKNLAEREAALVEKLSATDAMIHELVGVVRSHAKDMQALLAGSLQPALVEDDKSLLESISGDNLFPGMADITAMAAILRRQMEDGGAVRLTRSDIVDRTGRTVEAEILLLGNFTAAYRLGDEIGYLNSSPAGHKLFALSRLPSDRQARQLRRYMDGKDEAVPLDISKGAALGQMSRSPTLRQQIESGGPLVWPILAILVVGILIVFERSFFLFRNRLDADALTNRLIALAGDRNWQACREECARLATKPVARVIAAGLAYCEMQREAMENALQEAILKEIPPMERFLSTLGMLAAIAPLLGLLGTVTGMIDTFGIITQHGTGDSRMMSGGISVALVTTMLGLSVAIPIMLVHTLLNRAVDNRIALLEEKAVALINIVEKGRAGNEAH
ncbi:MAG: hypothetical protein VR65_07405 [Desulfobulbaceae bacterium BRH_c16a]|nr:MAG: hypothetical protein VR65_07405 [Desulfobulbaceae bacterium BRH_c16a]